MITLVPVVLCGGAGARLWPLSRAGFPKQFLCLFGNESLFQQAIKRFACLLDIPNTQVGLPYIVSNEEHRFLLIEQLREINSGLESALLEPVSRNTAPALTLAALAALEAGGDPILVVTPADQAIPEQAKFSTSMRQAVEAAERGSIVILGIKPTRAESAYGYIKVDISEASPWVVERFVEKPDSATARIYLEDGSYYWNAGIFILKASVWLAALRVFDADILECTTRAWNKRAIDCSFVRPDKTEFASIPSRSVDYAVLEHCPGSEFSLKMIALEAEWSDLGAWDAVWERSSKNLDGNVVQGDAIVLESHNTLACATSRLLGLVGVENLIVVETPDAVLVANRAHSQEVKNLVSVLNQQGRTEHSLHRKVHRPWGWYDSIDEGPRFKVKRIQVKPKASLSLQKHHHRAEHWVVVKGTAEITNGKATVLLTENQSTYIPLGEVHRLTNPGTIPLEIIEVQSGSYLGEDDIVRFEDNYGRSKT